jgi:antitoxin (DNA-binding transcriptional repressor) of toxin-antitoxin stability system
MPPDLAIGQRFFGEDNILAIVFPYRVTDTVAASLEPRCLCLALILPIIRENERYRNAGVLTQNIPLADLVVGHREAHNAVWSLASGHTLKRGARATDDQLDGRVHPFPGWPVFGTHGRTSLL